MNKVVVIGAGAAGIIAALKASDKNEVILIDGNDKCGKKLLVTGNGKCNYWNENINSSNYFVSDIKLLDRILENKEEVLNYLYSIGIYPKIKNGYYYPASNLAASIREIFDNEIKRKNITTLYSTKVLKVDKVNNKYVIKTESKDIEADKVIIATGSKAAPKTGSDGFGYDIAKTFNHNINPVLPSLVSLISNDKDLKECSGVRCDVKLELFINNENITEEIGELQLNETGISGICTFNISGLASKALYNKKKVLVRIDFVPYINDFKDFFEERNNKLPNRTIEELLESLINYKLTNLILKKSKIKSNSYWNNLSKIEKELLINNIKSFEVDIKDTNSFDKAQVCTGGIPLNEVNNKMESNYHKDLYFVGEILDVDGKCGGFNLAFAFITGYIAGSSV